MDGPLEHILKWGRPHSSMLNASILLFDLVDCALKLLRRLIGMRELPIILPGIKAFLDKESS